MKQLRAEAIHEVKTPLLGSSLLTPGSDSHWPARQRAVGWVSMTCRDLGASLLKR